MSDRRAVVLWAALAAILGLRVAAGLDPGMRLWGLDPHRFLPLPLGWWLLGLSALALIPAVALRLLPGLGRLGEWLATSPRAFVTVALVAAGLCWFLFDLLWFTGDFLLRQGYAEQGRTEGPFRGSQPLDVFIHGTLPSRFAAFGTGLANVSARLIGALDAAAFGALCVGFVRALGLRGENTALGAGLLLFGGYLTMFTGLGKAASEMCVVVAAFAVCGVQVARGRRGMLALGAVLALGFLLHRSALMLVPAWIVIGVAWLRRMTEQKTERGIEAFAAIAIPVATMALTLPGILAMATGYDLNAHVMTPAVLTRGWLAAALDPGRIVGMLNVVVALSPLAWIAPLLLLTGGEDDDRLTRRFLVVLAISFIPAVILIQPQHGHFKDWDVFAPAAVAWSALASFAIAERRPGSGRAWLAIPILAAVAIPALQWLFLNRHAEAGLARVRAYAARGAYASAEERAHAWDFLTTRNFKLGRWPDAAQAAAHVVRDAPHRRTLLTWALAETMRGQHGSALAVYRRMLVAEPRDPLALVGLVGAALRVGDTLAADSAAATIQSFARDGPEAREIARHLSFFPQVWPDSAELAGP